MRWSARGEGEKRHPHPQHPLVRSRKLHSPSRRLAPLRRARRRVVVAMGCVASTERAEESARYVEDCRAAAEKLAARPVPSLTPRAPRVVLAEKRSKRFGFIVSFLPPAAPAPTPSISRLLFFPRAPSRRPSRRPPRVFSSLLFSSLLVVVVFQGLGCSRKDRARCRPALQARGQERGFQARSIHWSPYDPVGVVNADSLRTFAGVVSPPTPRFQSPPRGLSTPSDAYELHPDIALYGTTLSRRSASRRRRDFSTRSRDA